MKTYRVDKLPGEAIVISKALSDWSAAKYFTPFVDELIELVDEAEEAELWYIADLRDWKPDFTDIILAANQAARGAGAILHHPKIKHFIVVTTLKVVEMAAKGLDSDVFGHVPVSVYHSVEEALTYIRSTDAATTSPTLETTRQIQN